jgi:membrane associated rhomboid family serine protease
MKEDNRMFPLRTSVPVRYPPYVTWTMIGINCVMFFIELGMSEPELEMFLLTYALIPARYFGPGGANSLAEYLPFITNMFLHAGWLHLILNMWMLWLFGPAIEDRLGHWRYLAFYLLTGIAASVTHAFLYPDSIMPALGASGAIAGVLGCFMRLFAFARLIVMVPILFFPFFFEVPAWVFAGLWFLLQVVQGTADLMAPTITGGVAWWAHIGGFVTGFALTPLMRQKPRNYRPYYGDEGVLGFGAGGRR